MYPPSYAHKFSPTQDTLKRMLYTHSYVPYIPYTTYVIYTQDVKVGAHGRSTTKPHGGQGYPLITIPEEHLNRSQHSEYYQNTGHQTPRLSLAHPPQHTLMHRYGKLTSGASDKNHPWEMEKAAASADSSPCIRPRPYT